MLNFKSFMLSFMITLFALSLCGLLAVYVDASSHLGSAFPSTSSSYVYTPSEKDSLTAVSIIDGGRYFSIFKFDARKGVIPVLTLDGSEELSLDGSFETISSIYNQKGQGGFKKALSQNFGLESYSQILLDETSLDKLLSVLGKIYYKNKDGEVLSLSSKAFLEESNAPIISEMLSQILNKALSLLTSSSPKDYGFLILDSFESDISYYDLEARRRALEFVYSLKKSPAHPISLDEKQALK